VLLVPLSSIYQFLASVRKILGRTRTGKIHDFTGQKHGHDYVLEPARNEPEGERFYMTGQGRGIRHFDYLLLQQGTKSAMYQVEEIDYYSNPSDMWIALLKRCERPST
jgi:hypothetical protein